MGFPQGLSFRSTAAFVTDVSPNQVITASGAQNYPFVTAQGNTVGWDVTSNLDNRNRNAANDARLAGICFGTNSAVPAISFRIDLPAAGQYNIRLAAGDASTVQTIKLELFDDVTSLGVLLNLVSTSAGQRFFDATGVERTNANWSANNVAITKTFASTICRFKLAGTASVNSSTIAYFYIEAVAAAGNPWHHYRQMRVA